MIGEEGAQRLAAGLQVFHLRHECCMAVAIGHDRHQPLDLRARLEHGLVRARQVLEVRDHVLDAVLDRERLQHVGANEVGQVADGLHRHGLVEQVERLLAVDAEAAAEGSAIGRERVEELDVRHLAQAFAQ